MTVAKAKAKLREIEAMLSAAALAATAAARTVAREQRRLVFAAVGGAVLCAVLHGTGTALDTTDELFEMHQDMTHLVVLRGGGD